MANEIEAAAMAHIRNQSLSQSSASIKVSFISGMGAKLSHASRAPPALIDPYSLDLCLFWQTPNAQHIGQVNIHTILPFSSVDQETGLSPSPAIDNSNIPIRFLVQSSSKATHNFATLSFCIFPIKILVKNISPSSPVSFYLEALKMNQTVMETQGQSRSHFLWTGITRFNTTSLAPNGDAYFDLQACFSKPGVYNINRYRIVLLSDTLSSKDIYPSSQHLITIEEA